MANVAGMCTTFKLDLLNGRHAFSSAYRAADAFKAALYLASASPAITAATGAYTVTGEISGGSYTAGGVAVTFGTAPTTSGTSAFVTPSATLTYPNITATGFDTALIYNDTAAGKNAVGAFTFASQTVVAGTFILSMPANAAGTALIGIS